MLLLSYHYPVTHTSKDSFISFLHSNCSFSFPRLFSEGRRGKEELGTLDLMMWSWGKDAALKNISKDGGLAQSSPLALLLLFLPSFETELQKKEEPVGEWQLLSSLLSAISLKLPLKTWRTPPRVQNLQTQRWLLLLSLTPKSYFVCNNFILSYAQWALTQRALVKKGEIITNGVKRNLCLRKLTDTRYVPIVLLFY